MKTRTVVLALVTLLLGSLAMPFAPAQSASGLRLGRVDVQDFAQWAMVSQSAVAASSGQVLTLAPCLFPVPGSSNQGYFPLSTAVKFTIQDGSNSETLTPSAISSPVISANGVGAPGGFTCSVTATFSNAHAAGLKVSSGDFGAYEAVNFLKTTGGIVTLTPGWGGTLSTFSGITSGGSVAVGVEDTTTIAPSFYAYNGSTYIATASPQLSANGASMIPYVDSELLTLSTSGTTTDTTGNLLHANSLIFAAVARVTTTITTATDWKLGDASTAGRFSAANSTMTAGTTQIGAPVQFGTGVASATTGIWQSAAAKLRVTTTGTPGAGAIRITVIGFTLAAPAS